MFDKKIKLFKKVDIFYTKMKDKKPHYVGEVDSWHNNQRQSKLKYHVMKNHDNF